MIQEPCTIIVRQRGASALPRRHGAYWTYIAHAAGITDRTEKLLSDQSHSLQRGCCTRALAPRLQKHDREPGVLVDR
jgi:hypothetical protein